MKGPLEHLENLQNKPEAIRRAFAIASVFVIMAVIVSVWFANFSISDSGSTTAIASGSSEDQPSPFTLLWNYSKEAVSQTKEQISGLKDRFSAPESSENEIKKDPDIVSEPL